MDLVLGGTRLKMGTDGSRRWGLLATRLMHGDYDNNLLPARRLVYPRKKRISELPTDAERPSSAARLALKRAIADADARRPLR